MIALANQAKSLGKALAKRNGKACSYQGEWKDTPGGPVGEGVQGAEGQTNVPLSGRDGVADINGADGLDLETYSGKVLALSRK